MNTRTSAGHDASLSAILKMPYSAYLKILAYAAAFFLVYSPAYRVMLIWWEREDYNYCYLVPFVVLYLLWEKRERLLTAHSSPTWWGLVPFAFGVLLFWLGELGGEFYTIYMSSWFVLMGICLAHLGWRKLKTILFPLVFVITMFPPPNFVFNNISLRLKLLSSKIGVDMMQAYGMSAFRDGNIIDLGFTQLQVVDACSGLRYLIPLMVLGLLLAHFFKAPLWKRTILFLSTIPISIIVNSLRIAAVGVLYQFWGPAVAEGFFHDFSGWLIFMVSLGILLGEMWVLKKLPGRDTGKMSGTRREESAFAESGETEKSQSGCVQNHGGFLNPPQLIPLLFLMLVTAVISLSVEFREKTPIARPFNQFPSQIGEWNGSSQSMDSAMINALDLSDYFLGDYQNSEKRTVNLYVAYYESQAKGESIHSPASCLPGSGWSFDESGIATVTLDGPAPREIKVMRAVMKKAGALQVSYYWFPARGRILTDLYQLKFFTFWDALTKQRTDGALIRLITPVFPGEDVKDADARLHGFVKQVLPVLNQFLPTEQG